MIFVEHTGLSGELGQPVASTRNTPYRPMALQYAVTAVLAAEAGLVSFPNAHIEIPAQRHAAIANRIMITANQEGWANPGYTWSPAFTLAEATTDLNRRGYRAATGAMTVETPVPLREPTQVSTTPPAATVTVTPTPVTPYQPVTYSPGAPVTVTPIPESPADRTRLPQLPITIYSAPVPGRPELREHRFSIQATTRQVSPGALRLPGQMVSYRAMAMVQAITEVLKAEGLDPQPFSTRINISAARHTAIATRIMQTVNEPGWVTYPGYVWTPAFTLADAVRELKGRGYWPETAVAPPDRPIQIQPVLPGWPPPATTPVPVTPMVEILPQVAIPTPAPVTTPYQPVAYRPRPATAVRPTIEPVDVTPGTKTVDLPLWPPDSPVSMQVEPTEPLWEPTQVWEPGPTMQQQQTVQIVHETPPYPLPVDVTPVDVTHVSPMVEPAYIPPVVEPLYTPPLELPLPPLRPIEEEAAADKSKAWIWAVAFVALVLGTGDGKPQKERQAA